MFYGRVFPTHVGMNRQVAEFQGKVASIPHARGDEPIKELTGLLS